MKWRALAIFSLLLLAINSFSTFYFYLNLSNQFELDRKSSHEKHVRELNGLVSQSSAKLLTLADLVPSMSGMEAQLLTGNARNVTQAFDRHWQSLQLGAAVDMAQIYSADNELVQSWRLEDIDFPDPMLIRGYVQEVNKTERPLTFLDCANKCVQIALSPMLAKDKSAGVIVLGTTLAAGILSFKEVSGADIGILNVERQHLNAEDERRRIPIWRAHVSALTNLEQNLPLLQSVAAKKSSLNQLSMGTREIFNEHEFEIHLLPVKKFSASGDAYFVLIDDITQSVSQIHEVNRKNILVGVIGLVLSESLLLLLLWGPLSRLRRTAAVLPLLAKNEFEQVRNAVSNPRRKGWYRDEFDMLDDTLVTVSQQLETLQAEVAQRTAELSEANKLLGKLNEELDQKVRERTRQLLEAQDELVRKEKLAVLGQVAGSVGHELRNPLGVMSNAVYFLQTVLADADDSVKEYLSIIKNEITGSERIVSDLLDSVRIKPPHPESVSVAELIEQSLRKCSVPPFVTVKLDVPATLPPLRVDALQIHQVLRNLISNGIEAMPQGGLLEIQAEADEAGKSVTINVRDGGIGMAPEQLGKLFQPLFTTKARGIGLGLVVVKNLTQANGGKVDVQSAPGRGTTFSITLPSEVSSGGAM
ncbi:MAG TPA: ATP-binding protein [Gallionella sp.]|nr:ATP-binding protein [Gallionella sp.]